MASGIGKAVRKRAQAALSGPSGQAVPALLLSAYLRRTFAATDWESIGHGPFEREAASGAVIVALWHGRLMGIVPAWHGATTPLTTLTSTAYPGRLAGQVFRRFGLPTVAMHDRKGSRGESLPLARAIKGGMSVGIAVDGPLGPTRVAKTVPLDWSRLTGAPIWCVGFSMTRFRQLDSWDRLLVPKRGGRGAVVFARFGVVEKRSDIAKERARLEAELNAATDAADRAMGHVQPLP